MSAIQLVLTRLSEKGCNPRQNGAGWTARCPGHDDQRPSLAVKQAGDRALITCHATCPTEDVVAALGITMAELFDEPKSNGSGITATYDYTDESGELLFQVVRKPGKQFLQRRPDGNGDWEWKLGDTRRVLYRLGEVVEAVTDGSTVFVVEGEKDADRLAADGYMATCNPHGAGKWRPIYNATLSGADVVIVADRDKPGRAHARDVAKNLAGIAARVRIVEAVEGKDVSDHLAAGLAIDDMTVEFDSEDDPPGGRPADHDELLARAMPGPDAAPRRTQQVDDEDTYDDVPDEPGHVVLDAVRDWLAAHVAYQSLHHAPTVTLFCTHTHALDRASSTPRIVFESPEPESGKTRNLELMECVCRRGKLVLQMSPASIYRWVQASRPSILLDELDAVFGPKASKDHEDLRALINAGHRPGATVPRVETPSMRVVEFSCYCPVALAGITGALPETVRSRSIRIPMRRRSPDEKVRAFRERTTRPEGEGLRRRLAAWVSRHGDEIAEAPELPEGVTDRQADQWEPLIAIADAAGGHWPEKARAACIAIVTEARGNADDQSLGVRLLSDIRDAFKAAEQMRTGDIIARLIDIEEAPWAGWLEDKSDKARGSWLARKLKPYSIKPKDHRFDHGTYKGYAASDFHEAWSRYVPPLDP